MPDTELRKSLIQNLLESNTTSVYIVHGILKFIQLLWWSYNIAVFSSFFFFLADLKKILKD